MKLLKSINNISFSLLTPQNLISMSVLNVTSDKLYNNFPNTIEDGALSRRLGISMKESVEYGEKYTCHTCGLEHPYCLGHFGHIILALPIFHPAYALQIQQILQQCCWHCGCCRDPESPQCPNCGQAKQIQNLQINPIIAKQIFDLIPIEERPLLCYSHPENLILSCIPVPPACIRPTIQDKQTDDDLTRVLCKIIKNNRVLKEVKDDVERGRQQSVNYLWNQVQQNTADLIGVKFNYQVENLQIKRQEQLDLFDQEQTTKDIQIQSTGISDKKTDLASIISRLSGKYGRFRANLSGKRVNFTGRSVISPDVNLKVGELGIPYLVGRLLTMRLEVNEQNLTEMQNLLNSDQIALIEKRTEQQAVVQRNELFISKIETKKQIENQKLDENDWVHYQWISSSLIDDKKFVFERIEPDESKRKISGRGRYRQTRINNLKWFQSIQSKEYDEQKQDEELNEKPTQEQIHNFITRKQDNQQYSSQQQQSTYNYLKIPSNTLLQQQRNINIQPGDIVHRFLQDGDVILFNRQPSLHKTSIQQFKVKLHNFKSFKFNPMCCKNLNADFDGDESNIQLPQGVQVQAEAEYLMKHEDNLIDIANKSISYNVMQDAISGIYILTREATLTFDQYQQLILINQQSLGNDSQYLGHNIKSIDQKDVQRYEQMNDYMEKMNLKPFKYSQLIEQPAILYPKQVYTGKQLVSKIIQTHTEDSPVQFIDENVKIINGEIMSGVMTGKILQQVLQSITENNILYTDNKTQLETKIFNLMYSLQRIIIRYIQNSGFSLGIGDVWPTDKLEQMKLEDTEESFKNFGYDNINQVEYSWNYNFKNLSNKFQPVEKQAIQQIHEQQENINKMIVLSDLRTKLAEQLEQSITGNPYNSSLQIMVSSGAKGSNINQIQMTGILAMQNVSDQMINPCFGDRVLPHFIGQNKYNLFNPYENGFVQSSYFNGLTPYEFITHTTAGRVGVIDSSVKTAQTGYIQRKLLKNLESCVIDYLQNIQCNNKIIKHRNENKIFVNQIYNVTFQQFCQKELQYILNITQISVEDLYKKQQEQVNIEEIIQQYAQDQPENIKQILIDTCNKVNQNQLMNLIQTNKQRFVLFIKQCLKQLNKAPRWIEPGTPIGSLAGQSLGEPTTQMTLKSFHFTGLQSKIQGFQRLKQLYDAVKKTNCNMYIYLAVDNKDQINKQRDDYIEVYATKGIKFERTELDRQKQAIYLKNQFEPLYLGQVADIDTVLTTDKYYIRVILDTDKLNELMIEIKLDDEFISLIQKQIKCFKIQANDIQIVSSKQLQICVEDDIQERLQLTTSQISQQLSNVQIYGIKDVSCDIQEIQIEELHQSEFYRLYLQNNPEIKQQSKNALIKDYMLFSSTPKNILQILNNKFVDQYLSYTSDIFQTYQVFGVEAARFQIAKEIHQLYIDYGFNIQYYHCDLIASFMCQSGKILGYTNQGLKQTKVNKTILLASFERTGEYLLDAGLRELKEKLTDVSEDIIFGNNVKVGSGYPQILYNPNYK